MNTLYYKDEVKMHVYCPADSADNLRLAIAQAGGGKIGNYSHCAFVATGDGYFMPCNGANPAIGDVGVVSKVSEVKIEFICHKTKVKQVMQAIQDNHPYEEVACDIMPLLGM